MMSPGRMAGSSPLARGLHPRRGRAGRARRIIPARAGFTRICVERHRHYSDHPRSRGVYTVTPAGSGTSRGSSPLARGLRQQAVDVGQQVRIIPARAGFTAICVRDWRPAADHPRSRGVYAEDLDVVECVWGSSPLARGLLSGLGLASVVLRIIPARAGFTRDEPLLLLRPGDHPRSRGVYARWWWSWWLLSGSYPLARGLLPGGAQGLCGRRIIPARAGFTNLQAGDAARFEDHPRSRGVYGPDGSPKGGYHGSSPLARGLLVAKTIETAKSGIIPARAGFTGRRTR